MIVFVIIAALSIFAANATNAWSGWAMFVFLGGMFFLQGLRQIPAKPPHKGQLTVFGKRAPGASVDEGWGFFPIYPFWFGFVMVKVERFTFDVTVARGRTPDRAESKIPVQITLRPCATHLMEFIDSGSESGVIAQLTGKIQERVREWAMGDEEGPATWEELNQSQLEGTSVLVKKIASNSLSEIPDFAQGVPTWIWLRFFSQPRPTKLLKNEKVWAGNDWEKVRNVLDSLNDEQQTGLKTAVDGRRAQISALRTGKGKILLDDLGVTLERLNIGDVDVLGETGKTAELQAKEEQERQGEKMELNFVRERIKELMSPPFNFSSEKALEVVQTERGKVKKEIRANDISISPGTFQAILPIVELLGNNKKKRR
ncbi:MAG: hypothetical protein Q8Q37_00365 [bacterium]|nr:hypothetical protein [bacterium]